MALVLLFSESMLLVAFLFLCCAVIIQGALGQKPVGWAVVAFASIALILAILGGVPGAQIRLG